MKGALVVLNPSEKAHCRALVALKNKDYRLAVEEFDKAAPFFREDKEFALLRETTRLLVTVQNEIATQTKSERLEIEEVFSDG